MRVYFDTDEDVLHFMGEDLILVFLDSEDEDSIFPQIVYNYSTNDGHFVLLVISPKLLHCKTRQDNCSELCADFTLLTYQEDKTPQGGTLFQKYNVSIDHLIHPIHSLNVVNRPFIHSFTCLFILTFVLSNPFTYPSFSITYPAKYILMLQCLLPTKFVYASCITTRFNTTSGSNNLTLGSCIFPHNLLTIFKTATNHCVMKTVVKSSDAFRGSTSIMYRSGGCSCSPLVISLTSKFYFSDLEEGLS